MATTFAPQVVTLDDLRYAATEDVQLPNPNDPAFECRMLAEGDSWFSIGAFPSSNLLYELALPKAGIAVNLAYPGDTVEHMSSLSGNPDLRKMLHDEQWGYKWDLILFSGGGNDIIGRADNFIRPAVQNPDKPESWIDRAQLDLILVEVKNCYRQVVAVRDEAGSINAGKPVVVHTYDYPMPRNAPAKFLVAGFTGPWLYRSLTKAGTPAELHFGVAQLVIDALADGLLELTTGAQKLPNFFVVNTRGTLTPAEAGSTGNSNDWLNEIHPNHQGYRKLARKISTRIGAILK